MSDPFLWYRDKDSVSIGGVRRYIIKYKRIDPEINHIYFRLKNIENSTIRAIHLLNGPFILYCHVIPVNFNHKKKFSQSEREIHFNNSLKPGQTFNVKLLLNENSRLADTDPDEHETFCFQVEVISQIVISKHTQVFFDLMVGSDLKSLRKLNHGPLLNLSSLSGGLGESFIEFNRSYNPQLQVQKITDEEIWSRPPDYNKPVHLIILTHGIFSNLTGDMLYLKESLESSLDDNVLIKGFSGNAGRTERGIKRMGSDQGDYLIQLIENLLSQDICIDKISFIGHSLGGLTQLYSIKYILDKKPGFFAKNGIKPHNLVFMASPLLGILNEISFVLSWLLDLGTLGRTGRDLTLSKAKLKAKPLLETLPDQVHGFMKQCKNLIIYANIINDGIVPLRTSGLLYLDYVTLDNVKDLKHKKEGNDDKHMGEIPAQKSSERLNNLDKYKQFISMNLNFDSGKKRHRLQKKILQINAKGTDRASPTPDKLYEEENEDAAEMSQDEAEDTDLSSEAGSDDELTLNIPPKTLVVASAINTLISPIPNQEYILDPGSRHSPIFHDKFYNYMDLPPEKHEKTFFNKEKKQVRIARKYHNELNWRKILVRLPPDAHNNIIVRRRFPNGYGWGVVDHLCQVWNDEDGTDSQGEQLEEMKSKM